ncbi:hypothetical protein DPMN_164588 [Dreissena polymorpha]|uniref:Uncharacterized protein n=1 Tax=Dreissena polymorpha TaxID=45954 RepID=A0A9D4EVC4_DREPO|nr:hypothetical protein DPMN_164588 [Dreissena polymorpha]
MCAGMNSRDFWSSNNMLEVEHRAPSSLVFGATQQALKTKTIQEEDHRSESGWNIQRQPWDVELTDDSNRAEQCRKRRRRFKKRNIAEKVNGTCKQVPTVNKDFICCETTQQKKRNSAAVSRL